MKRGARQRNGMEHGLLYNLGFIGSRVRVYAQASHECLTKESTPYKDVT